MFGSLFGVRFMGYMKGLRGWPPASHPVSRPSISRRAFWFSRTDSPLASTSLMSASLTEMINSTAARIPPASLGVFERKRVYCKAPCFRRRAFRNVRIRSRVVIRVFFNQRMINSRVNRLHINRTAVRMNSNCRACAGEPKKSCSTWR